MITDFNQAFTMGVWVHGKERRCKVSAWLQSKEVRYQSMAIYLDLVLFGLFALIILSSKLYIWTPRALQGENKSSRLDLNKQNGCKATSITEEHGSQAAEGVEGQTCTVSLCFKNIIQVKLFFLTMKSTINPSKCDI